MEPFAVWIGQLVLTLVGAGFGARWALSHERRTRSEELQIEWLRGALEATRTLSDEFGISGTRALAPDLSDGPLPYKAPATRLKRIVAEAESYLPKSTAQLVWLHHVRFELPVWDLESMYDPEAVTLDAAKAAGLWTNARRALDDLQECLIAALGDLIEKPRETWPARVWRRTAVGWSKLRRRIFGPGPWEKALGGAVQESEEPTTDRAAAERTAE